MRTFLSSPLSKGELEVIFVPSPSIYRIKRLNPPISPLFSKEDFSFLSTLGLGEGDH
jgi:hypothetical protein